MPRLCQKSLLDFGPGCFYASARDEVKRKQGCEVQQFLAITKALSDESRLRVLLGLRESELCLCQIVEVLGLAPSTVSRHLNLLRQAGLVDMRKDGRWRFYRLAGDDAPLVVQETIGWVLRSLEREDAILADAVRLSAIRADDPKKWTTCYNRS